MRQFRGLTKDGKWVYGWYVEYDCTDYQDEKNNIQNKIYVIYADKLHHVIPETVGQYTGLKDKNGKEIYEGDIVKHTALYPNNPGVRADEYYTVKYRNGCFVQQRPNGFEPDDSYEQVDWEWDRLEIIGDIHTTPKLLEKSK